MAQVRVRGEGGAEFVLDDTVAYVAAQLETGHLVRVDEPKPDQPTRKRRTSTSHKDDESAHSDE